MLGPKIFGGQISTILLHVQVICVLFCTKRFEKCEVGDVACLFINLDMFSLPFLDKYLYIFCA